MPCVVISTIGVVAFRNPTICALKYKMHLRTTNPSTTQLSNICNYSSIIVIAQNFHQSDKDPQIDHSQRGTQVDA